MTRTLALVALLALTACGAHQTSTYVSTGGGGYAVPDIGTAIRITRITGTDGDDVLIGTDGPDLIEGGAGNDVLCGGPRCGELLEELRRRGL